MLLFTGVSSGSSSARLLSVPCRALYQFPPLCSSAAGILLRISCIFFADGAKTHLQGEDLLEVEPLVCRGTFPSYAPAPARRAAGVRFPCVACGASVSATATSPATGSASGRPYAVPPGSATGCRMSAATPSPRTMPPCSGICRSCSWRWATAIPRFCARVTWYPPGAKMPRASGKVPDCPGAQKHTCKGRMEPRPDKRTA